MNVIKKIRNIVTNNKTRQLELRLKTVEQEYNVIRDHSKTTIWIIDIFTFRYMYISSACKYIYGYDEEEYSQLSMYDVLSRDSIRKVIVEYNRLRRKYYSGEVDQIEATFDVQKYHKDGHLIWIEVSAKLVPDGNGKLTQIIGQSHIIDVRKKRELALAEIEQKWKILSDHVTETVFILDTTNFNFRFMSDAAKVLGYTAEETKNIKVPDIFPPESIQLIRKHISEEFDKYYNGKLPTGKLPSRLFEVQQYHKNGNLIWTEIIGTALPSTREDGKLTLIIGTTRNINDKKLLELKLLEQNIKLEQQHQELILQKEELENIRDAIFILDVETFSVDFRGKSSVSVTGYAPGEALNYPITAMFPTESLVFIKEQIEIEFTKYYKGELEGKLPEAVFEIQQYHKDGSLMWVEVSANALPSIREDGKLETIIGSTRRIDKRKEMEFKLLEQSTKLEQQHQELMKQKEELEYVNRTKDKFFSIIAHDLRNPITAMINIASVFRDYYYQMDSENIMNSINVLFKSTANISNLLENLLQWSRSSIGSIEFHSVKSNIVEIVNISFEDIGVQAQSKNIKLVLENKTTPDVYCDPNMINTILRNLISNAIKFSKNDKSIYIIIDDYIENNKYVIVSVKDEGIGMAPDALNKLFKLETKASTVGTAGEHGTGLGLILCKEFIDKHNCKIWVESEIGKGTTFNFTLLKA